ncbi:MAG: site-specific DNA-methyltransferase [Candidatus Rokubacteria bacterium]|nr:site-specific DNA-methyltransferase [Candidatus Rokubacteria bacterium]
MTQRPRTHDSERRHPTHSPGELFAALLDALNCGTPVTGLTHSFYRYPARFSPQFARKAIEAFTKPGDTVFDPFMGGGTTVVEALASGRRCIGSDLNPLAKFLAKAKTTPISKRDARALLIDTLVREV